MLAGGLESTWTKQLTPGISVSFVRTKLCDFGTFSFILGNQIVLSMSVTLTIEFGHLPV